MSRIVVNYLPTLIAVLCTEAVNWILSHWAHVTVHRFICVYLCVFCVFLFHTAYVLYYCEHGGVDHYQHTGRCAPGVRTRKLWGLNLGGNSL